MIRHAQPYPWDQLPRLTGMEARRLNSLTRTFAGADARSARSVVDKLIGTPVSLRGIALTNHRQPSPHTTTLELNGDARIVCEIPGPFAAWIVERALGGDADLATVDGGLSPRDETSLGVLAYVATRMLPTLPVNLTLEGVDATSQSLRTALSRTNAPCVALRIGVGSAEVVVHLWMWSEWDTPISNAAPRNNELMRWLLEERVTLSAQLVHGIQINSRAVAALMIDDVITLHAPSVSGHRHHYEGEVHVITLGAPKQRWLASAHGDQFELQHVQATEDRPMTTGKIEPQHASHDPMERALTAVADAPLELSVELARFTLPLGEIAALTKGDVLMSGRPIGEHVTLRAGSRALATGELVNVDGTIGVRIVSLAGA